MAARRKTLSNLPLLWRVLAGTAVNAVTHPTELRYRTLREFWLAAKRGGSTEIRVINVAEVRGMTEVVVEGYVDDYNRAVIAALCSLLQCKTFFEFGTERGKTTWTVARNNPETALYTLDLPSQEAAHEAKLEMTDPHLFRYWDRGSAFANTQEDERIKRLSGDSASFDYAPYEGKMDMVYVDGSHSYEYVKNDTEAAFRLLSPSGAILWDDYPDYPGVYRYLNDLARQTSEPFFHFSATRLALYARSGLVERLGLSKDGRSSTPEKHEP